MSRTAWSRLAILLVCLPIASCIGDDPKCTTCPPENSAKVDVVVTQFGLVDSVHISIDGGATQTVKRGRRGTIADLSPGVHSVATVRYFSSEGLVFPRSETFQIKLARGESRTIVFHNDYPLVAWREPAGDRFGPGLAAPVFHPVG
ncbi:MAG TPA: hypothetical protein VJY35_00665 [Candidatus Eisenbacteria bacterium]|nr:hypothetical protein [Candidatus Eisenbacteria bacterium]